MRTTRLPRVTSAPFWARVIAMASVSLPGPEARSRKVRALGRRRCMISIPATGSSARISTQPGLPVRLGYQVQAFVHAVDEVDVRMAGRSEDHARAIRDAAGGVRRQIVAAQVRLCFDDPARRFAVDQDFAQQVARDFDGGAVVERSGGGFVKPAGP